MKKDQKVRGGIFLKSRKVVNDGSMRAGGDNPVIDVETDSYVGAGNLETIQSTNGHETTLRKIVIGVLVVVIGGLVLYFVFGIK